MSDKKIRGERVSLSGLAAFFGVHRNTVTAWVKRGLPYVQKADRDKGVEWIFDTAEAAQWRIDQAVHELGGDTRDLSPAILEQRKLAAETELAEVKAALAKGEVASLDEIRRQLADNASEVKARLRQIPSRAAPQLLGVQKEKEIKAILLDEIDEVLTSIAYDES